MKRLDELSVKIYADGADLSSMRELARLPFIRGFTTNPALMRQAGITDVREFARLAIEAAGGRDISFSVFSDEPAEMERQAHEIAGWGDNVYVKIPVTTTRGESCADLARRLSHAGVKVNATALLSLSQVRVMAAAVACGAPATVSLFAGRVADTGRDPVALVAAAVELLRVAPNAELIWASPRELLNIFHADAAGCHIITVTPDLLAKLPLIGRDLDQYSLETVRMFHDAVNRSGYRL